jgi:hypothetical protein
MSDPVSKPTKWRYKVFDAPSGGNGAIIKRLDEEGADGWELVSVTVLDGGPMRFFMKKYARDQT